MNLPNKLTMFRIFMIPVFMLVLIFNWPAGGATFLGAHIYWSHVLAAVIFAVASITDFLDGHIARSRNLVTNFGKFADPLADKMLTMTTGLRLILAENEGQVLAAKMPGKIKTTTQMLSIIFLLLGDVYYIGTILLYICLIFTIYSGYDYFKQSGDVFKGEI